MLLDLTQFKYGHKNAVPNKNISLCRQTKMCKLYRKMTIYSLFFFFIVTIYSLFFLLLGISLHFNVFDSKPFKLIILKLVCFNVKFFLVYFLSYKSRKMKSFVLVISLLGMHG